MSNWKTLTFCLLISLSLVGCGSLQNVARSPQSGQSQNFELSARAQFERELGFILGKTENMGDYQMQVDDVL